VTDYTQKIVYIGIDVHKKTYAVTAICDSEVVKKDTLAAYPEQLVKYITKHFKGAEVHTVYETGFSGFHLHKYLVSNGINNIVVHPASIKISARVGNLKERLGVKPEFKFNKSSNKIRDMFFQTISRYDFSVRALVVKKELILSSYLKAKKNECYNFFIRNLMSYDGNCLLNASV